MPKRASFLSLNKAIDLMHAGGALQTMHAGAGKVDWFLLHKAGGRVKPEHAEKIKAMPDICAAADGLFPGLNQTWRMVR
jgi:hypothetical protein